MSLDKVDVICLGQAVVDCITRGAKEVQGQSLALRDESICLSTGGDAVNESFVLAGMGYKVDLACGLGSDLAGDILLREAKRQGVGVSRIVFPPGLDTPIANLMVSEDGSRRSVNSKATMLEGYIPDPSCVKGARIVSLASLFRAPLDQKEVVCDIIRSAHDDGAVLCADTKLPTFRKLSLEDLKEVLPLIDYLFPNEKEAAYHTGESDFSKAAAVFHGYGIRNVIIKAGGQGCYVSTAHEEGKLFEALPVKAVDTTGAGDNFVAGFISGLLEGETPAECCRRALIQAAKSIQHIGAVDSMEKPFISGI